MRRGRFDTRLETHREAVEGDLADLGNARVYLDLIRTRVRHAARAGHRELLFPALEDLLRVEQLVTNVQRRISAELDTELYKEANR
jgi:hypothetical protein